MTADTIRFGLLGSGFMARTYAECLARHTTGTGLMAVAGGSRAASLASDYGADCESSVDALLARDDIDAVILATPHSTHLPLTVAAAAAGKHVYVEKPMGRTVDECDAMIEACRVAGVLLVVNKVTRFRASPRHAKRLLDEGAIGSLQMIRVLSAVTSYLGDEGGWTTDPAEGGAWLDMGAHLCDATRWLTGSEPVVAFGSVGDFLAPQADGAEDLLRSAMAQFTMANGVRVQILMSLQLPTPGLGSQSQWTLIGTDGIVECDSYGKVRLGRGNGWEDIYEMPSFALDADTISPIRLEAFAAQTQDFADAIRHGRPPIVGGAEGRAAIEMVEAVLRSSQTLTAVPLPLTPAAAPA
jgi:predicted dehydrogenase